MSILDDLYYWVNHGSSRQQRMEALRRREVEAEESLAESRRREVALLAAQSKIKHGYDS